MTIEQIKQCIQELRAMRDKDIMYRMYPDLYLDSSATAQAERDLRDKLRPLGLSVQWFANVQDYGIYCIDAS